jgi:hypothetical protein
LISITWIASDGSDSVPTTDVENVKIRIILPYRTVQNSGSWASGSALVTAQGLGFGLTVGQEVATKGLHGQVAMHCASVVYPWKACDRPSYSVSGR